jgi:hypothetical protein
VQAQQFGLPSIRRNAIAFHAVFTYIDRELETKHPVFCLYIHGGAEASGLQPLKDWFGHGVWLPV